MKNLKLFIGKDLSILNSSNICTVELEDGEHCSVDLRERQYGGGKRFTAVFGRSSKIEGDKTNQDIVKAIEILKESYDKYSEDQLNIRNQGRDENSGYLFIDIEIKG